MPPESLRAFSQRRATPSARGGGAGAAEALEAIDVIAEATNPSLRTSMVAPAGADTLAWT